VENNRKLSIKIWEYLILVLPRKVVHIRNDEDSHFINDRGLIPDIIQEPVAWIATSSR
jgi:hypothetical protein